MNPQTLLDIMQESFKVGLMLSLPIMLSALTVGVAISVLQAVTSVQEQTMVFVPKIISVVVASIVFFSWMMEKIMRFTITLLSSIPELLQ